MVIYHCQNRTKFRGECDLAILNNKIIDTTGLLKKHFQIFMVIYHCQNRKKFRGECDLAILNNKIIDTTGLLK